jgi:hypothetical protein
MGESPWGIHESADSIPRLQWAMYDPALSWQMRLGCAVAASACVPTVFAPFRLGKFYKDNGQQDIDVTLVDGGVHDNQGTVALLASGCNLILVSDACGQLMLERAPLPGLKGLFTSTLRSSDTLMERVRLANFADLDARRRSGLLRGLMFLHMKAGLDADVIRLNFSREAYALRRASLSPSGVAKDFQQAFAELRTDLDAFKLDEANGLMACGYQMASKALDRQLPNSATSGPECPASIGRSRKFCRRSPRSQTSRRRASSDWQGCGQAIKWISWAAHPALWSESCCRSGGRSKPTCVRIRSHKRSCPNAGMNRKEWIKPCIRCFSATSRTSRNLRHRRKRWLAR